MTEDEMVFAITDSMDMCLSQLWALVKTLMLGKIEGWRRRG